MSDGRSVSRRIFVMGSLGSALAAGCGGGSSPAGSLGPGRGAAQFTIRWPELKPDSRLIPTAAKSITVKLVGPVTVEKTVARPAAGTNQTTISFPDLQTGAYTATATAYPNADGTGVAQATGTVPITIVKGQTASESLTMGTTITKVTVSPASFTVAKGGTTTLTATAYDASNAIVLTGSTWNWASSDTSKATASGATTSGTVTGVASGSVTITATESESGKFGSVSGSVGFNQGEGLADSSWPRRGANQWNTHYAPVPGNTTGIEKWSISSFHGDPVVDSAGNIYVSNSGKVYKVSPSGTPILFYTSGSSEVFLITIGKSDTVYLGYSEKLHKINPDGTLSWTNTISPPPNSFAVTTSINIHKNNSIFTTQYFLSSAITPPPNINSVSENGDLQWTKQGGSQTIVSETRISSMSSIYMTRWFQLDGSLISGVTSIGAHNGAQSVDGSYYFIDDSKLVALDANLNKKWEINSGGTLIATTPDNKIIVDGSRCYNSAGTLLWTVKDGTELISGWMAVSSTTMYVTSGSNVKGIYAINLSNGNILWKKPISFPANNTPKPALGPDGTLYISYNGNLTAYH